MKHKVRHYKNLIKHHSSSTHTPAEPWFVKYWRPAAGWIYLAICFFDFIVMPLITSHNNLNVDQIVDISSRLRPEDKLTAFTQLTRKTSWEPLTLQGNGMFHMAFGALLSVASWGRSKVQEAQVNQGIFPAMEEAMLLKPTNPVVPGMSSLPLSGGTAGMSTMTSMPMNGGMGINNNGIPMNNPLNNSLNMPINNSQFNNIPPNPIPSSNHTNPIPTTITPTATTPPSPHSGTQHNIDAPP